MSIYNINGDEIKVSSEPSSKIKSSLLDCLERVAWIDVDSQDYYNALENALYSKDYPKIIAVYDTSYVPFIGDDINVLKSHLTVTYYSESEAQGTILSPNDYTLLGNLESNVSRVTVMYDTCTYTFTVNPVDIYNKHTWNYPSDTILHSVLGFSSNNSDIYVANDHRSLYIDRGKTNAQLLYTNGNLINDGNAFMIPIPDDATKATVTIPSSWVVAFSAWDYSNGRDSRAMVAGTSGWQSGTATITFTARENLALGLSYKLSNNAVITSQDVSAITIVFE